MQKLFISYCHQDKSYIERFVTHLVPLLERMGEIELWYDQSIIVGEVIWDRIEEHLSDGEIICLMVSANYLVSAACKKEMNQALSHRQHGNCSIIPILLSDCGWKYYKELSALSFLPLDAKPISSFADQDAAWEQVVTEIEKKVKQLDRMKRLNFSTEFDQYLDDASIFTKAHSAKAVLKLSDIFIYPDLALFKEETSRPEKVSSLDVVSGFSVGSRIIIIGEDQSGKTALAKILTRKLRDKYFVPVYLRGDTLQGNLDGRLSRSFSEEYAGECSLSDFAKDEVVPIIDDFHKAKNRDKILDYLSRFKSFVIIVDEAFDLDYTNNEEFIGIQRYRIREFKPSFRNQLIRKWLQIRETNTVAKDEPEAFINREYAIVDNRTRLIEDFLGKAQSQGIMPSYPFFILTALVTIEDSEKPLDEGITSQGYCYQSLIYFFLKEQGVKNEDIDSYINFLTEFSAELFRKGDELSEKEYHDFVSRYEDEFVLTKPFIVMESCLLKSRILRVSSLKNYSFEYPYLYYFFAGKYFAEQFENTSFEENQDIDDKRYKDIDYIFNNLHVSDNAYIAIFIAHHSKNKRLIERLLTTGRALFSEYSPASLSKKELSFFDSQQVLLPNDTSIKSPDAVRSERLKRKDQIEEIQDERRATFKNEDDDSDLSKEIRRSIKTVEVIGRIIRNRTGSLRQSELSILFKTGMNIHLRLISSFFVVIANQDEREATIKYIRNRVNIAKPELDSESLTQLAEKIFWNMNFGVVLGLLGKITFSLGSDKLTSIIDNVVESQNTEATFIIRQAITMYYKKNLQVKEIERMLNDPSVSEVSKHLMYYILLDYCQTHRIDYRDRSRLINLGLKPYQIYSR